MTPCSSHDLKEYILYPYTTCKAELNAVKEILSQKYTKKIEACFECGYFLVPRVKPIKKEDKIKSEWLNSNGPLKSTN